MGLLAGIVLVGVGALGAASLIIARRPQARALFNQVAPWQGWIGTGAAIFGAWGLLSSLMTIGWLETIPLYWLTLLGAALLELALGLLLGVGVLKALIKDPAADEKLDRVIARLAPWQGRLGLCAIALGAWVIAASLLWSSRAFVGTGW